MGSERERSREGNHKDIAICGDCVMTKLMTNSLAKTLFASAAIFTNPLKLVPAELIHSAVSCSNNCNERSSSETITSAGGI